MIYKYDINDSVSDLQDADTRAQYLAYMKGEEYDSDMAAKAEAFEGVQMNDACLLYTSIRKKGSDGGHNGIKNIIYLSGKDTFPRIKMGVGAKPRPDYNLADWVLSQFTEPEKKDLCSAIEKAVAAATLMVEGKTDEAMNRYNS